MLVLGVPTLNRYDLLQGLINSAEAGTVRPDLYYVIDNGGQFDQMVREGLLNFPDGLQRVEVYRPGRNAGVAGSWNQILRRVHGDRGEHDNTVIISGDDIVLGPVAIERMVDKARQSASLFICANGASAWSLFLQKRELAAKIGYYDEKFWPAYYEDNDYHRRMRLAGEDYDIAPEAQVTHATSSTINAMSKEERTAFDIEFNKNQRYYGIKWGGPPGYETQTSPLPNAER